ncbi:DNA integrity scanning diadenylate cyclase DisA [Propionispora hippei]|uniref:diadenylate cyclase n=1 Tax=Propionispora hippei DSM 15287 TaxID=1123003 RepID=A0A1M6M0H8_9FIRM|nr:DNA integrity scanning diadenylate cyclase DisA [Propionispora hippei]SHJ76977.1 diadenylate cyclase [Propionispora hippei DSM 15287]
MTKVREEDLWNDRFIKALKSLAPGTLLRDGLENVLRAKMGALVLIGDSPPVMKLVDGGFNLHCDFTPAGFYELAKMDGALQLSADAKKIVCANAQLIPDPSIPTAETGTRHRTAERVAKQTGALVIAISQRRNIITVYMGNLRYTLKDSPSILNRANQALQTLEKYRAVFQKGLTMLSALEFEDMTTLADVAGLIIKGEQVARIARGIRRDIIELGEDGRLLTMQLEEKSPEEDEVLLLIHDYAANGDVPAHREVREQLAALPEEDLEPTVVCRLLGFHVTAAAVDMPVLPRGYRILRKLPRLPVNVIENLVLHFKTLHRIYNAGVGELDSVEGIGEVRAKNIKDGLKRVRDQVVLERYL